jgi:DNA-binding MarR family transcriptional regulator
MTSISETAACEVIEVVPLVMRAIRTQMRQHRAPALSVAQFRVMAFVDTNTGASLSAVAEHIGVTLPSMSKMVDGLVEQKLLVRELNAADRRRMTLGLTPRGRTHLNSSRRSAQDYLARLFATLGEAESTAIVDAMTALRPIFSLERARLAENEK